MEIHEVRYNSNEYASSYNKVLGYVYECQFAKTRTTTKQLANLEPIIVAYRTIKVVYIGLLQQASDFTRHTIVKMTQST